MLPVTVVIPTKDRPALLRRAVRSVLAQRTPVEAVIVVDDGSRTPVSIEDTEGGNVTVCRHSTSKGPSGARNAGVGLARTRWVTFLDDDDELDSNFASELSAVISGTPAPDFIWSGVRFRRSDGSIQGERTFSDLGWDRASICREALDVGTGYGLTVLTALFRDLGEFDESLRLTEDTDFMIRAIDAGLHPAVIRAPMVQITNHTGDRQTGGRNDEQRIKECEAILAKYSWDGDLAYVADWLRQRIADLRARLSGARIITKCEGFTADA